MGVHGLWRLIEPSGKPVPLETLENKILAVDISIWLHQAIKGYQDSKGAPLPNAHLLGIYHRVCKLLYFRVKPVFVFDGGVPGLKKLTIAKRNQQKAKNLHDATDIQTKLLKTLIKHSAISKVISEKSTSPQKTSPENEKKSSKDSIFKLPEPPATATELDSTLDSGSSSDESSSTSSPGKQWDLHTIDEKSEHFRSLPADVRHEILTEIMETRKQSSWGRLHEIPTESNDFSSFQMKRLLKRFSVQTSLEEAVQEMGGHSLSLGELEKLLNAEGIVTDSQTTTGQRIASNDQTRYLLIKDVQKAMEVAKKEEEKRKLNQESELQAEKEISKVQECETHQPSTSKETNLIEESETISSMDKEFQRDLAAAIQLSLQDQPSTSKVTSNQEDSFLEHFNDGDFDSESDTDEVQTITRLQQAKSYMMEYSGLTPIEIDKIINANKQKPKLPQKQNKINNMSSTKNNFLLTISENETNESNNINNHINSSTKNNLEDSSRKLITKENNPEEEKSSIAIISDSDNSIEKICISENKTNEPINFNNHISSSIKNNLEDSPHKLIRKENITVEENSSIEIMSDSDDSDFEEVKISQPSLQIIINPKEQVEDDIFSDIFSNNINEQTVPEKATNKENKEQENKVITAELKKTIEEESKSENIQEPIIITDVISESSSSENIKLIETVKKIEPEKPIFTIEELNKMKSDLVAEQQELTIERNTKTRIAGNITDQMYQEAQELLELFGIPYLIAPMEAEAQCAFLNDINLTDGTITDDSDIWLFGGKTVYKNFFNHNKHVLEFRAESIEHHFKLTREQLILLALLVGSDYTIGIQGIGPVTALEILAAFPPSRHTNINILTQMELISGLKEFRKWLCEGKTIGVARTSLRSKLKNVNINEGFPNVQVVQAYLQPEVETCADNFTWAKPDIVGLIDFAKEKFGWTKLKSEEILKPVIKRMEDKNLQKSIRDYFTTKHKIDADLAENKMSKRVKTAVKRMGSKTEELDEEKTTKNKTTKKTKKDGDALKQKTRKNTKKGLESSESTTRKTVGNQNYVTINKENPHPTSIEAKRRVRCKKTEQLHAKEYIPQKERDKIDALKSKLKAIEVFRKSKQGPGFLKKRSKVSRAIKEDAELSESSSDN